MPTPPPMRPQFGLSSLGIEAAVATPDATADLLPTREV